MGRAARAERSYWPLELRRKARRFLAVNDRGDNGPCRSSTSSRLSRRFVATYLVQSDNDFLALMVATAFYIAVSTTAATESVVVPTLPPMFSIDTDTVAVRGQSGV